MSGGHIFLVGFMGAGKSTVAEMLGESLGLPAIDLDDQIVQKAGRSVSSIFTDDGEEAFRLLESEALEAMEDRPASVVACGGGVVVKPENRAALRRLGTVVYLQVTAGEALARVGDADTRPLLAGTAGAIAATSLLSARESLYRSVADLTVDTVGRDPEQVADDVAAGLGMRQR